MTSDPQEQGRSVTAWNTVTKKSPVEAYTFLLKQEMHTQHTYV